MAPREVPLLTCSFFSYPLTQYSGFDFHLRCGGLVICSSLLTGVFITFIYFNDLCVHSHVDGHLIYAFFIVAVFNLFLIGG